MKQNIKLILVILLFSTSQLIAQDVITVNANSNDISDNLDLEAVAYLFGKAENLETFEKMLNDPEVKISNLDLNNDGYIDYLRVIEANNDGVYVVIIQAVLGQDIFQDIATIDVDARDKEKVYVQIVGNEYIYGANYIFEPVYVYQPVIYSSFWYPQHVVWYSPYYWSYYPSYYSYRKPYEYHVYHHHVYEHYHQDIDYRYVSNRRNNTARDLHKSVRRNDLELRHPNQSFSQRNNGVVNQRELNSRRTSEPNTKTRPTTNQAVDRNVNRGQSDLNKQQDTRGKIYNSESRSVSKPVEKSTRVTNTNNSNSRTNSNSINSKPERNEYVSPTNTRNTSEPTRSVQPSNNKQVKTITNERTTVSPQKPTTGTANRSPSSQTRTNTQTPTKPVAKTISKPATAIPSNTSKKSTDSRR